MGKFGDKLRRERELRGVTLDEIAEATKIGTRSLCALEEERCDQLPGGIFNNGFALGWAQGRVHDSMVGGQPWSRSRATGIT